MQACMPFIEAVPAVIQANKQALAQSTDQTCKYNSIIWLIFILIVNYSKL